jgi:hypothetical protein
MGRLVLLATTALVGYACWRSDRKVPRLTQADRPLIVLPRVRMKPTSLK